jgi:hypothetical protein
VSKPKMVGMSFIFRSQRKQLLFVNKKKQKNFMTLLRGCGTQVATPQHQSIKNFLVLFYKKALLKLKKPTAC